MLIEFFPHAEGYVKQTTLSMIPTFDYVYNYTDHLGNIRLSYAKDPSTGDVKILEENHYYPFGLKHQKYTNPQPKDIKANEDETAKSVGPVDAINILPYKNYDYKYNGKEFQDELGLNMYDMDMRMYDPAIARWVVLDPVIHHSLSPYNAFDNNPVFWADPSGADGESPKGAGDTPSNTNIMGGIGLDSTMAFTFISYTGYSGSSGGGNKKSNGSSGSSPIGGVSASWTPEDEAQFPGGDGDPGATELPAVVANSKQSLNAGLESRAITAISIWSNHNFGSSISSFDPNSRGFWGKWGNSSNFFGKLSYNIANSYYLAAQVVDADLIGENYVNPITGLRDFTNLDGSQQYNIGERAISFTTSALPFLAETKMVTGVKTLNASQFSSAFKGTIVSRSSATARGWMNRSYNSGVRFFNNHVNNSGMFIDVVTGTAENIKK